MSPARGLTAALAAALASGAAAHMHAMAAPTGADILNFALNLECLEATFYSYAAFGHGLSAEQRGGGPEAIGGMKANLTEHIQVRAQCPLSHLELRWGAARLFCCGSQRGLRALGRCTSSWGCAQRGASVPGLVACGCEG